MALLDVILGYDCNLGCDYCTITPEMRKRSLPTHAVQRELVRARSDGFDSVQFTGGEPTIRPDLLPLVRHAHALGYSTIKIQSNGLLWAGPANVERAVAAGANAFSVSIHTHDAGAYERLVRVGGGQLLHPLMESGLTNLVRAGVDPSADVIIKSDTQARLQGAVEWLHGLGVRRVDFWFVSLTDGNRLNFASMPRMTEAMQHLRPALARARALNMQARSLHLPRCVLGPDADHAWDPAAQGVRVLTPDAIFDLMDSKLTPRTHVAACAGCADRLICAGVRHDYLERYGMDEIIPVART